MSGAEIILAFIVTIVLLVILVVFLCWKINDYKDDNLTLTQALSRRQIRNAVQTQTSVQNNNGRNPQNRDHFMINENDEIHDQQELQSLRPIA